jgi:hypothetical protein
VEKKELSGKQGTIHEFERVKEMKQRYTLQKSMYFRKAKCEKNSVIKIITNKYIR